MFLLLPNKPIEIFKDRLPNLENYIAQQKLDGWRTLITKDSTHKIVKSYKNGNVGWAAKEQYFFLSRRDISSGGPTNIPINIDIVDFIDSLNLPDNTMLDAEWLARRTIGECPEGIYIFDIMWYNNEWLGSKPFKTRFNLLREILESKQNSFVKMPEWTESNYEEFFQKQTKIPYTEGIVLKKLDSTIISDRVKCVKNPAWLKCKWRSGSDGRETFNLK